MAAATGKGPNVQQAQLLDKLQLYIEYKKSKYDDPVAKANCKLPFESLAGLCSGLVAYWLYCKRTGMGGKFLHKLQYIANWDATTMVSTKIEDQQIEDFLNIVGYLQFDYRLREGINQATFDQTINNILSQNHEQVEPAEYMVTHVFDHAALQDILSKIAQNNKMVRVSNGLHVIGICKQDDGYYFYDPDAEAGPTIVNNPAEISTKILESLGDALRMDVYDLHGAPKGNYQDVKVDASNTQQLLSNDNIFHLAARYSDFALLDKLFACGYKYIPWTKTATTELNESIILNNQPMFAYLLQHNIPLEYRLENGLSPLATAVVYKRLDMLYTLLTAGADPNAKAHDFLTLWQIACIQQNVEAIITLIACGANVSPTDLQTIKTKFGTTVCAQIIKRAAELNAKLLALPDKFVLDNADFKQVIAYLIHQKLKMNLGLSLQNIQLQYAGKTYTGESCLQQILTHINLHKEYQLYEFAELVQAYSVLSSFYNDIAVQKQGKIIELLDYAVRAITAKSLSEHTQADLIEIPVIVTSLQTLLDMINPSLAASNAMRDKVTNALTMLQQYLQTAPLSPVADATPPRKSLFFTSSHDWVPPDVTVDELRQLVTLKAGLI